MRTLTSVTAAVQAVLIFPAALFIAMLVVRDLQSPPDRAASIAQQVVLWYAGRMWTLWLLLLALPLVVVVTGCAAMLGRWSGEDGGRPAARNSLAVARTDEATRFVAAMTLAAGAILAVVVLHMLAN